MKRFTVTLSDELDKKFKDFQKRNNINCKTKAVQECIRIITSDSDYGSTVAEIEKKLRTILHRQNIQKKLMDQMIANFGFPVNERVEDDKALKEFYEKNFDFRKFYHD